MMKIGGKHKQRFRPFSSPIGCLLVASVATVFLAACDVTNFMAIKSTGFKETRPGSRIWKGSLATEFELSVSVYSIAGTRTMRESASLHVNALLVNLTSDTLFYSSSGQYLEFESGLRRVLLVTDIVSFANASKARNIGRVPDYMTIPPKDSLSVEFEASHADSRTTINKCTLYFGSYMFTPGKHQISLPPLELQPST